MFFPAREDKMLHPTRKRGVKQRARARYRVAGRKRGANVTYLRLGLLGFGLSLATSTTAPIQSGAPLISVEQRIEAATRALGYFERSHEYNEFRSILLTLLEVNGHDNAAAPLNVRWDLREQQIKETYGAWFQIFRALDAL